MPLRLYRYILFEMIRVILITTGVLVTVIAFGAVIKPLAGESLLTAGQAVKYVFLAMVPMLQYALPFAAGFGSTLALHRFTGDNEILAMSVVGLSYRAILAPVVAFGLLLTLLMVILTQSIIPQFYGMMARTLAGDVTAMIAHSVEKGVPFEFEGMQILAEHVEIYDSPQETGADERLRLRKMIAAQLDKEGRAVTDVTAADAVIDIYRRPGVILLKLAMEDAVSYDGVSGDLRGFPRLEPTHAIPIPSPEMGEPGAMTYSELLHVRDHPQAYPQVDRIRESIAQILGDVDLSRTLDETVGAEGAIELVQPGPMNRSYLVRADQVVNNRFRNSDGSAVEVTEMSGGEPSRRFRCRVAQLVSLPAMGIQSKQFNLELLDLVVEDLPAAIRSNARERILVPDVQVPAVDEVDYNAMPLEEVAAIAQAVEPKSRQLTSRLNYLDSKIAGLERQVISRLNRRYALSVTACLLLVLGAVLAMLMRHALPLSVYMWAFLPALLDLVLISSGSSMIRAGSVSVGLVIMWSGNGLLLCMLLACYARLSRH
tara:strand:+ start:33533 stop:35158 length:1626 start_codon:yes stop_codon:yes gene_type:complete